MQGSNYIEAKDILDATNGGLEIIFMLYPEARGSETRQTRKFKTREEKTPSASLIRADDGNWLVTDFGDGEGAKPRNGILCYAHENGLGYIEALRELAAKFNVISIEKQMELIRSEYSARPAEPDELERSWTWEIRNNFSDFEIETIISKNVLSYLGWASKETAKKEAAYTKVKTVFQEYHWHPLISYSLVKDRKKMTFSSTETYPIFLIDEGSHQKIYQPRHPDKSKRFMYAGEKPKDFIHGLEQLTKIYKANEKRILEEGGEEALEDTGHDGEDIGEKKSAAKNGKSPKVESVTLCSGGSDAINVALLGYRVLWMNSETAKLHGYQYDKIARMAHKFYNLPDIDLTGRKAAHLLAMEYLEIFTIELPEELTKHLDGRGNPCKDLRDYLNHFTRKDYKLLVDTALPYRFWNQKAVYEGKGESKEFIRYDYDFENVEAYNFLLKNGFGRLLSGDKKTDWMYIRRVGNIVYEQQANDIKNFVHNFLRQRLLDKNLRKAMYRSNQLADSSLSNLDEVTIDFTDNTKDSQFVFFPNHTVEVSGTEMKFHKPGTIERYIWDDDMLQHRFDKPKQSPFTITKDEFNNFDITINDTECPFLKYLVQTSRVHWRKELEVNLESLFQPADRAGYLDRNHCTIAGENLSPEEIEEQKQHLINKLFVIGFLLHRYKARNKGWFVFAMDDKKNDDGKSHGGSGKSILFDMAMRAMLRKNFYINGRNPKLTDDPHRYDGLTEHHRYILIDDAHEYLKLDAFYTDITGDVNVNPKGKKPFSIPFEKSAKFAFTTNYTPRDIGPSTERRMIYTAFSDYYHNKGETDDYRELRDPKTDLGITLFMDFGQKEWNSFYSVMLHSLQFFLSTEEKVRPAMENVNKRNLLSVMGNLHDWALIYFSEDSGNLDVMVVREEAFMNFKVYNGGKAITPQSFLTRIKAFCRYYGFVLNPIEFQDKNGKIIKKTDHKVYVASTNSYDPVPNSPKVSKEMLYIQTKNELKDEKTEAATEEPVLNFRKVDEIDF